MNKLIVLGFLALIINTVYATYSFDLCVKFKEAETELKGLADSEDFDEICPLFRTTGDFTHCCFIKETKNDTILSRCVQITDDQYENIKNFKKYIIDENGDEDFEIDCSSRFLVISLFAVLAFLF